jgi:hypothetical protein
MERSAQIIADRARGLAWHTIATRYGLSTRQCMKIWALRGDDYRLVESPREELESEIDALNATIDELAQLAEVAGKRFGTARRD